MYGIVVVNAIYLTDTAEMQADIGGLAAFIDVRATGKDGKGCVVAETARSRIACASFQHMLCDCPLYEDGRSSAGWGMA